MDSPKDPSLRHLTVSLVREIDAQLAKVGERGSLTLWVHNGRIEGMDVLSKTKWRAGEAA